MSKQTDLAYCAGIVDGEGCIRIKRSKPYGHATGRVNPGYHAIIQVRMVDEGAIRFLAETIGGWYYPEKPHAAQGRPLFCWQASDAKAESMIRMLLPYLRIKRAQAETVLALREHQSNSKNHRTMVTGDRAFPNARGTNRRVKNLALSPEYIAECERLCQLCSDQKKA